MSARSGKYTLNRNVLDLIWLARLDQKRLIGAGKIPFTLDARIVSDDRKLTAVASKLGAVAEAISENQRLKKPGDSQLAADHLREPLVDLTASLIAWLEGLEGA